MMTFKCSLTVHTGSIFSGLAGGPSVGVITGSSQTEDGDSSH